MITLFRFFVFGGLLLWLWPAVSQAQITLDGTLGPKGPLPGPDYAIDAKVGQLRGNNLFHSFGQFNVHTGERATFTGPPTVENVIGRVTGGQQSLIDGRIRSEMPQANMYLLNPSGVLFRPNATLDVPGSFHVSTADYLRMADGEKFSANLSQQSVLTSAPPAAFGFLSSNPAPIAIQGSSLQVSEGKTLSVVGGDLQITGGRLSASGGQLNLASVASAGEVIPTVSEQGPDLKMEGFGRLGTIEASQGTHINTDGEGGGTVLIRGGRLVVDNATISSNTQGDVDGARVGVDAQIAEDVVITNAGRIETTTLLNSTGNGGSTELKVNQLTLTDGARIDTSTSSDGQGGTLTVTATDSVSISGRDNMGAKSGLFSNALGKGNAGNLSVSAPTLAMADGGIIDTHTAGDGNAGNIEVQGGTLTLAGGSAIYAGSGTGEYKEGVLTYSGTGGPGRGGDVTVQATESISIAGRDSDGNASALGSGTFNKGDAGKIFVSAPLLQMDEGIIFTNTLGDGNAGDIDVQVGQLTLTRGAIIAAGVGFQQFVGIPFPQISTGGPGRGGDLTVHATEAISLFDNSVLASITNGKGNAGKLSVSAPTLLIDGRGSIGGIFAFTVAEGNAGAIDVQGGKLTFQNGGQIFTGVGALVPDGAGGLTYIGTDRTGHGGDLTVKATDAILISGQITPDFSSGLFTSALKGSGDGGQLFVSAPVLDVRDGGGISSNTSLQSTGNAGGIRLEVGKLTVDRGFIVAYTAAEGNAGDIDVQARELTLQNGGLISSSAGFVVADGQGGFIRVSADHTGQGGNIRLKADRLTISDSGFIDARTLSDGNGGAVEVRVGTLILRSGGVIATNTGFFLGNIGAPGHAGTITIIATDSISISGRDSEGFNSSLLSLALKGSGDGGQIFVSAPVLNISDVGGINTSTLESTGNAGDITLEVGKLTMTGDTDITTITEGPGQGGDIHVQARQIELNNNNNATITASSSGAGNAGTITIHADDTFHSKNSVVSTSSTQSGGGKIDLSAGQIVELVDSQITTNVQGETGDAGNITIDPRYVILNNSRVIATAVGGNGGNIRIGADVFLASPTSVVDASSQTGISGTIDIRGAVSDLSGSIAPLPQGYLSTTALSEDRCAGRLREGQVSSFVVAGREGMPLQPGGVLPSPLYEVGQGSVQGGTVSNEGHTVWQVPRITPIALDGGCGKRQ